MNIDLQNSEHDLSYAPSFDQSTSVREEMEIEATLEEWANFMRERNLEGALSVYGEKAINYDLTSTLSYKGIQIIREKLEKWFASFESDIVVDIEDVHIRAEKTIGFAHCLIRFMGDKAGTHEGEDMYNRTTFCFEKVGNDWLISHEHSSLPFNLNDGKVMLDLRPHH